MNVTEKAQFLVKKCGEDGILDLSKHMVRRRIARGLKDIKEHFNMKLTPAVTLEEHRVLMQFARCKKREDVGKLLAKLYANLDPQDNTAYLRTAIDGVRDQ